MIGSVHVIKWVVLPLLTKRERRLRLGWVAAFGVCIAAFGVAVQPWISVPVIFFMLGAFAAFGLAWYLRHNLAKAHYRSIEVLKSSAFLVCPGCLQSLHGLGMTDRCPECGRSYVAAELRRTWMDAYQVHLNRATSTEGDGDDGWGQFWQDP